MDQALPQAARADLRETGRTFPADEVVWGFVVRPGFDEIDDPYYHRGTTQHAYLEGNDLVSLCGFRPPRSGPRTRRRSRLGLPTAGLHPMCGMCARKVVAPRARIAVPVAPERAIIPVPDSGRPATGAMPMGVPAAAIAGRPSAGPVPQAAVASRPAAPSQATSPWVRRATAQAPQTADHGLMSRGVHADMEP
jgi:hypothetical protein